MDVRNSEFGSFESSNKLDDFQKSIIGYNFQKESILAAALSHRNPNNQLDLCNQVKENVRLQFLGSSVYRMLVSEMVFNAYPNEKEGFLSKLTNRMYSKQTVVEVAKKIDLCEYIMMDGVCNDTCLSNGLSALLAAIYLDGGLDYARRFVVKHWEDQINNLESLNAPRKVYAVEDPKSKLIEWANKHNPCLPKFTVLEQSGLSQEPLFVVSASVGRYGTATGKGITKKMAEKQAAEIILKRIEEDVEVV